MYNNIRRGRGLTIRQLLEFYADLGQGNMRHFDPSRSTTHDVARLGSES